MTGISEQDYARIGESLTKLGKRLRDSGSRADYVLGTWRDGPRSPSLQPNGGRRTEQVVFPEGNEVVDKPSDPTGEAAIADEVRTFLADEWDRLVKGLHIDMDRLHDILDMAVPSPVKLTDDAKTFDQIVAEGYCRSCFRDHGYLEPVAMRPNGQRKYRAYCNWCGEFMAAELAGHPGTLEPPIELIEQRRLGKRLNRRQIDQAVAEMIAKRAEERREAKKKGKGKKAKAAA